MHLQRLSLTGFKNYSGADLSFSEKINCFVGNNGTGKTNLLDAIHYLSYCKSYFNPSDYHNIRHDDPFFVITGSFSGRDSGAEQVQVIQKRNQRKRILLNKKEYERLSDHIGRFPVVMISPYDRDLINDGSEYRRKYIDGVISQFDRVYLDDLIRYNKVLTNRNILLKRFAENHVFDRDSLEIWDRQMVELGTGIWKKRKNFLDRFVPVFRRIFEGITGGSEAVDIGYESALNTSDFGPLLDQALPADRSAGFSTAGIHKDDLIFFMNTHPVKRYGSQGQQKSFVVAIKLAQFEYTREIKGFKPILLLDDIFDKLDDLRVARLFRMAGEENFGQVFVTDTSIDRIKVVFDTFPADHKVFYLPFREDQ